MKKWKRLIDLIEKGDASSIFEDKCLANIYNDLKKFGMVKEYNGVVFLTPKGNDARLRGLQMGLEKLKMEEEVTDFSDRKGRLGIAFFFISLLLFLTSITLFLLMNFTTYTLWS